MTVRRHADDLGGALFAVVQNAAALARIGVALPAEGDRWHFVLGGYFGDAATRTRDGVRTFARTLPDRAISDLLANDWLGEPASFRFPFSRRQHWERAARLPPGLVVGDAVASFNPQGMSSAALQAEALGALLDRVGNSPRLPHAFAKATAAVVANPWQIATGADLVYAQTRGPKGPWVRACSTTTWHGSWPLLRRTGPSTSHCHAFSNCSRRRPPCSGPPSCGAC